MKIERVLVIGCNGLLGQKVSELLVRGTGYEVMHASRAERAAVPIANVPYCRLDVTSKKDVKTLVSDFSPHVIINTSGMTNVDACESEREPAWAVNVGGVENLVEAARKVEAKLIQISSDYVFDGKAGPYDEDARPTPLSYYGKTKLAGENAIRASDLEYVIVRSMVLYGVAHGVKPNFALWLIQCLERGKQARVVDDQFGNPSLADDVAYGIISAVDLARRGIYNMAGRQVLSRYEFAVTLARIFGFNPRLVVPVKTSQLEQPAPRPLHSGLLTLKAEVELGYKPSTVEEGLYIVKSQLARSGKKAADSAPIPGAAASRHTRR